MAKRVCLLTGNETNCIDGCYCCGCGGDVALNDFYVPIYNIQRVCDIVKNMADVSAEGEEIAEYIRNELEKMTVCIENKAADVQPVNWISVNNRLPENGDMVMCYCKTTTGEGNVHMFGCYLKEHWWLKTCRVHATLEMPQMKVMYWLPLPEPPKVD